MILPLLLLFSWFTSYLPLMITSNGSPQDYGNYSNLNFTFEECVDYCNQEERCMVIYELESTVCQVFEIGEVKSVKRNTNIEQRFGYKVADSNNSTCPAGDTVGGEFVKRTVPSNQPTVVDSCRTSPIFKGVLSGLETPEEFDYVKEMADFFFNDTVKATFGMWLGGVRKPECIGNSSCQGIQAFSFSDPTLSENPTGFLWNPNQPDGNSNDCLAWIINADLSCGVSDFPCNITQSSDGLTYFNGYMCGREPA
ncbi:hypothetical protein B9Z55_003347 [Caenorhabditis nigoni]|uniref:PAN-3 domain-containing protein n=1 Tax=Caenorhabditis nigoni TaxID=1611254 RepID=A0A2G5VPU1_9PELO|nr:hypothetical protein B9Z55_003347 [Caenorhabditis nigoni]